MNKFIRVPFLRFVFNWGLVMVGIYLLLTSIAENESNIPNAVIGFSAIFMALVFSYLRIRALPKNDPLQKKSRIPN